MRAAPIGVSVDILLAAIAASLGYTSVTIFTKSAINMDGRAHSHHVRDNHSILQPAGTVGVDQELLRTPGLRKIMSFCGPQRPLMVCNCQDDCQACDSASRR